VVSPFGLQLLVFPVQRLQLDRAFGGDALGEPRRASSLLVNRKQVLLKGSFCITSLARAASQLRPRRMSIVLVIVRLHHPGVSPMEAACGTQITPEKAGLPECTRINHTKRPRSVLL
jgi:hypothetical protein